MSGGSLVSDPSGELAGAVKDAICQEYSSEDFDSRATFTLQALNSQAKVEVCTGAFTDERVDRIKFQWKTSSWPVWTSHTVLVHEKSDCDSPSYSGHSEGCSE